VLCVCVRACLHACVCMLYKCLCFVFLRTLMSPSVIFKVVAVRETMEMSRRLERKGRAAGACYRFCTFCLFRKMVF